MNDQDRAAYNYWRHAPATNGAIEALTNEVRHLRQILEKQVSAREKWADAMKKADDSQ